MKKLILPIFILLVSLLVSPVLTTKANAQPKHITCEEWKDILSDKECDYKTLRSDEGKIDKRIWCVSLEEIRSGFDFWTIPPDYTYDFDMDACLESWAKERGETPSVPESDGVQDKKSLFFIPTGLIDSVLNIFKSRPKTVQETQQSDVSIEDIMSFYQIGFGDSVGSDRSPGIAIKLGGKYYFPGELKAFVELEFTYLAGDDDKPAEPLFFAPFEDAKYTNSTQDPVRLGYNFGGTDKRAELVLSPSTEVTFYLDQATSIETNITPKISLDYGEIEVKIDNSDPDRKFDVLTDFLGVSAKYTHFWVSHDANKRQSTVGVYEGEVEVKTRDGKKVSVKPDGDKPGVVIVTQKLSIAKLAVVGVASAVIVVGIIWFIKKKTAVKSSKKR